MDNVTLVIEADDETSAILRTGLKEITQQDVVTARKEGLDGVQTTITLIQIISPVLTALAPILMEQIRQKKVKRIRYKDIEVDNPTEEQWKAIWESYQSGEAKKAT